MKNKPNTIKILLEIVCIACEHTFRCREVLECSKVSSRFFASLGSYDPQIMRSVTLDAIKEKISKNPEICYEKIKASYSLGFGIFMWINSVLRYFESVDEVNDLMNKLKSLEEDRHSRSTLNLIYQRTNPSRIQSSELSKALAPLIDREYELTQQLLSLNKQISEIPLLSELLTPLISENI